MTRTLKTPHYRQPKEQSSRPPAPTVEQRDDKPELSHSGGVCMVESRRERDKKLVAYIDSL